MALTFRSSTGTTASITANTKTIKGSQLSIDEGDENIATLDNLITQKEDNLGLPLGNDYVLISTVGGDRSWVSQSGLSVTITGQTLADGTVDGSHIIWNDSIGRWEENGEMVYNSSNDSFTTHSSNVVSGDKAIAFGGESGTFGLTGNTVNGELGMAWGAENSVGAFATVWGNNNTASSLLSTVWGNNNTASSLLSTVWGSQNVASNDVATAWGANNTASGEETTVWGIQNIAAGGRSTTWGSGNTANGELSTVWGIGNSGSSYNETVLGSHSTNYTPSSSLMFDVNDRAFTIGNGINSGSTSDATRIWKSGYHEFNGTIKLGNTTGGTGSSPQAGDLRYNLYENDFEGYDESSWKSLTKINETLSTGSTGVSQDIDWGTGDVFQYTLTNDTSFTFSNLPTGLSTKEITVYLMQDGTGNRTPTFPSSVSWGELSPNPIWTTAATQYDVVVLRHLGTMTATTGVYVGGSYVQ